MLDGADARVALVGRRSAPATPEADDGGKQHAAPDGSRGGGEAKPEGMEVDAGDTKADGAKGGAAQAGGGGEPAGGGGAPAGGGGEAKAEAGVAPSDSEPSASLSLSGSAEAVDLRSPTHIGGPLPAKKRMHWLALKGHAAAGGEAWLSERFNVLADAANCNGNAVGDSAVASTSTGRAGVGDGSGCSGGDSAVVGTPRNAGAAKRRVKPWASPTLASVLAAGKREREREFGARSPATGVTDLHERMADEANASASAMASPPPLPAAKRHRSAERPPRPRPEPVSDDPAAKAARERKLAEKRAKAEAAARAAKAKREAERERKAAAAQAAAVRRKEQRREREAREAREARRAHDAEANGSGEGSDRGSVEEDTGGEESKDPLDDEELARRLHAELNASPRAAPRRMRGRAPAQAPAPAGKALARQRTAPVTSTAEPTSPRVLARQTTAPSPLGRKLSRDSSSSRANGGLFDALPMAAKRVLSGASSSALPALAVADSRGGHAQEANGGS